MNVSSETCESVSVDKKVMLYLVEKVSFHMTIVSYGQCFDSMKYIGDCLNTDYRLVSRSVIKLIEHEVVLGKLASRAKGQVYLGVNLNQQWTEGRNNKVHMHISPCLLSLEATLNLHPHQ